VFKTKICDNSYNVIKNNDLKGYNEEHKCKGNNYKKKVHIFVIIFIVIMKNVTWVRNDVVYLWN
jgi:hypothetical protein